MERRHFTHFHIAGFTYWDGPLVFRKLKIGTGLVMRFEPDNRYDPKAVGIYYKDHKVGYVPRASNAEISKLLEMGHDIFETRIQQLDPTAHPEQQVAVIVYLRRKEMVETLEFGLE